MTYPTSTEGLEWLQSRVSVLWYRPRLWRRWSRCIVFSLPMCLLSNVSVPDERHNRCGYKEDDKTIYNAFEVLVVEGLTV